jgi:hypothetical protein
MASGSCCCSVIASCLPTTIAGLTLAGPAAAQLSTGPWPMFRHDVCHTGQSSNPGPRFSATGPAAADVKKWTGYDKIRTSPSLAPGGKRLYFSMGLDVCSVDTVTMTGSHSQSASYKAEDCYRLRTSALQSGSTASSYLSSRQTSRTPSWEPRFTSRQAWSGRRCRRAWRACRSP